VIEAAASSRAIVHDASAMSAQLWKRGGEEARVTFRCPWCDVVGVSAVLGRHEQRDTIWLLAGCPNIPCGRGVLIQVPSREPWVRLDTGDAGMLLAQTCVLPRAQ
jgi:hypothetical protein